MKSFCLTFYKLYSISEENISALILFTQVETFPMKSFVETSPSKNWSVSGTNFISQAPALRPRNKAHFLLSTKVPVLSSENTK